MSNQTLATRDEQPLAKNDIRSLLQSDRVREQIEIALPKHMTPERMMRVALTAVNKNPKLLECTPESVLLSLMTCSQYGVEPDGRNAHLIPYNNKKDGKWVTECQFQWDYKGLVAQIRKSPDVSDIYADIICENDKYKVSRGLHRDLVHEVDIAKPRGPMIAAYSVCIFRDGTCSFELMSSDEIEAIRLRSKSTDKESKKSIGPWANDYFEMAKKTVIKRHSKMLPLPTEIAMAVNADSDFDEIPAAQATEIKKASIPERTAIADKDPEQEAQPERNPEPEQKDQEPEPKAAQAREVEPTKKAKLSKKAPAPKDDPKSALISRTRDALKDAGFSEDQLVKVLIANEWGNWKEFEVGKTTADDFDMDILEALFEEGNWETIVAELNDLAK
ncbi:MAG: recombinase RecT [Verrucomicrobiae bacterium]